MGRNSGRVRPLHAVVQKRDVQRPAIDRGALRERRGASRSPLGIIGPGYAWSTYSASMWLGLLLGPSHDLAPAMTGSTWLGLMLGRTMARSIRLTSRGGGALKGRFGATHGHRFPV